VKIRLVVALVGLAIGFALPTFAQEQNTVDPEVRQHIETLFVKFGEAFNKRDPAAMAALFTQDAVQLWPASESVFDLAGSDRHNQAERRVEAIPMVPIEPDAHGPLRVDTRRPPSPLFRPRND
jgi:hypothetical protein